MSITVVEDALIAEIKAATGARLKGVESLPGDWDDEMLKRLLRAVPGAFVAFAGGARAGVAGALEARIDSRWVVYVCTGHASGEAARRRGDSLQVGAYELLQILVPRLHCLRVAGVGTLSLLDVSNLYTGSVDRQGVSVYAMTLSLPMLFELQADDALLSPFVTFAPQLDIAPFDPAAPEAYADWLAGDYSTSSPDARDVQTLPQP